MHANLSGMQDLLNDTCVWILYGFCMVQKLGGPLDIEILFLNQIVSTYNICR